MKPQSKYFKKKRSKQTISYIMSCIKGKDTSIELKVFSFLKSKKMNFERHVKNLPGTPDIVFHENKTVIFIDSCFWHGYRFSSWENRLNKYWRNRILVNRARDKRNFRLLRYRGWKVLRIWEHQIHKDMDKCFKKINQILGLKNYTS